MQVGCLIGVVFVTLKFLSYQLTIWKYEHFHEFESINQNGFMTELHKNSFCSCFLNEAHCLSQSCNKYETCLWVNRTHSLQQHYDDKLATNTPHSHNNQVIIMTDYMIFKQWLEMPCLSSQMSLNPQSSSKSLLCSLQKKVSHIGVERHEGEKMITEFSFRGELSL